MSERNPERMAKLLAQNHLKKRAAELIKVWARHGVTVSRLAHEGHGLLIQKLSGQLRWHERTTDDVVAEVRAFAFGADILTMIGWSVSDEPALLVSASKLIGAASSLTQIYPDGFILTRDGVGKALIVDIDDQDGTRFSIADLPNAAS